MRIKISKENDELLYKLKSLYNFKNDSIVPRIAFSYSYFIHTGDPGYGQGTGRSTLVSQFFPGK